MRGCGAGDMRERTVSGQEQYSACSSGRRGERQVSVQLQAIFVYQKVILVSCLLDTLHYLYGVNERFIQLDS